MKAKPSSERRPSVRSSAVVVRGVRIVKKLRVTRLCGHEEEWQFSRNRKHLTNLTKTVCDECRPNR